MNNSQIILIMNLDLSEKVKMMRCLKITCEDEDSDDDDMVDNYRYRCSVMFNDA